MQGDDPLYGHAGILGAAAAVWEDLRINHLLAALLDLPADEDCKPFTQHPEDRQYDPRMSHSEKDRHMQWQSSDASSGGDGASSHSHQPSKQAASAANSRTQGHPKNERGES